MYRAPSTTPSTFISVINLISQTFSKVGISNPILWIGKLRLRKCRQTGLCECGSGLSPKGSGIEGLVPDIAVFTGEALGELTGS